MPVSKARPSRDFTADAHLPALSLAPIHQLNGRQWQSYLGLMKNLEEEHRHARANSPVAEMLADRFDTGDWTPDRIARFPHQYLAARHDANGTWQSPAPKMITYAALEPISGRVVGESVLHPIDGHPSAAGLSDIVDPHKRGYGYGAALLVATVAEANHRGFTHIIDNVRDENERSWRRFEHLVQRGAATVTFETLHGKRWRNVKWRQYVVSVPQAAAAIQPPPSTFVPA